ncbi:hypothetical protein PTSG_11637 [Salpingoeca rosetta]|uniref:Condensin complex subunit 2 n=1 Tax=Salpingoeca rosetta (strain ATCC 50818 / BSB-021) TaxID=946362 RepID=F2TXB9_SALR5|nr:uncharacterized protein PTSG_11637 [Salpingoeca rosetta]EGD76028.1 hypothetical protein PTSG_11637 [Salpingoeca rosetta]|eukprot:XP_004998203.1 hypothetical protein PTSG_11637 [Salpingoeca rosetta]
MADVSTPAPKRDRRRVSIVAHRRALGSPRSPMTPGAKFRGNNDKLEKLARRRSMAMQVAEKKMNTSPFKAPPPNNLRAGVPPKPNQTAQVASGMSASQLTDLYANCIKMCSENKINQKNSWELPLIDYITDVMSARPGELTNFQMASVTLDASVKIYSCRVDSIHSEAYKVLGGISRSDKKAGALTDNHDDDEDDDENGGKKKRKRRARAVNTLESNPASLNVKKFDLQFDVDPLFKQTSAAFDEGGARGLLLNHLTVDETGTLVFDSQGGDFKYDKQDPDIPDEAYESLFGEWKQEVEDFESLQICPSLADFVFMGWEPTVNGGGDDAETVAVTGQKQQQQRVPATPMKVNMNAEGGFNLNQSDDDGDDFYDAFADAFEDTMIAGGDDNNVTRIAAQSRAAKPALGLAPFSQAMTLALQDGTTSEYSYFNEAAMKNWAGPSHWKFQKKTEKKGDDKASQSKKKKKEKFFIDFDGEAPDWTACFATSRAATTLAKSTLSRKPEEFLLPVDVQYKLESLTKLFTNPAMRIVRKSDDASDDYSGGDAQWYDYNNPNDANNFCGFGDGAAFAEHEDDGADFGGDDGADNWSDTEQAQGPARGLEPGESGAHAGNISALLQRARPSQFSLIDEPTKAQKIHINYAKQAKRINVKQVKSSMWSKLTTAPEEHDDQENGESSHNVVESAYGQKFTDVTKQQSFAEIVSDVPKMVPQQMGEQLSVPIMFVCLLHLANEKHLKITGDTTDALSMDDLAIIQG